MKKMIFAAAMVLGMSTVTFAHSYQTIPTEVQMTEDEFTPIDVKDLPKVVADSIAKAYPEATVKSAAVSQNEDGSAVYQVTLVNADNTETVAHFTDKGDEVK